MVRPSLPRLNVFWLGDQLRPVRGGFPYRPLRLVDGSACEGSQQRGGLYKDVYVNGGERMR